MVMTIELVERPYVPMVAFSETGPHLLLEWWTHEEQSHLIVGRSVSAVAWTFRAVVAKHGLVEVRGYWKAKICGLTPELMTEYDEDFRQDEESRFLIHLANTAVWYEQQNGTLPPGVQRCPTCNRDDYDIGCCKCHRGFVYERPLREIYEDWLVTRPKWEDGGFDERYRPVPDAKPRSKHPIYVVNFDGGHHCPGIVIVNLTKMKRGERFMGRFTRSLFFFQGEKIEPPAAIVLAVTEKKRCQDLAREASRRANERRVEEQRRQEKAEADALFAPTDNTSQPIGLGRSFTPGNMTTTTAPEST